MPNFTVGKYLATRLEQIGLKHYFMVPGDYNLVLLDELLENTNLEQIGCCNELNAAYAAEGYARVNGAGAVLTTFNVGAYSALNGVAGAYAERLPVIVVSSGPNTNDVGSNHVLHHTMDNGDLSDQYEIFRKVTCKAVRIVHPDAAPALIDEAISAALRERKPAYIEIPCNLSAASCAEPAPFDTLPAWEPSNERMLDRRRRAGQRPCAAGEEADSVGRGAPARARCDRRLPGTGRGAGLRGGGDAQRQGVLPRRPSAIRRHLLGRGEQPAVSGHRRLGRPHRGGGGGVQRLHHGGLERAAGPRAAHQCRAPEGAVARRRIPRRGAGRVRVRSGQEGRTQCRDADPIPPAPPDHVRPGGDRGRRAHDPVEPGRAVAPDRARPRLENHAAGGNR